jgi:YggT family protein
MLLSNALSYLLETVFHVFVLAALLRFFMQALRAPFRNPIAQFVAAITDFAVKPLRRIVPGLMGFDLASFLVAWIAEFILVLLLFWISGAAALPSGGVFSVLLFIAFARLLRLSVYLLIGVVLVQAILSWMNPLHPIAPFFNTLTRPFLKPLRRFIPLVGGVDLTPLVVLILCQLILMVPIAWLEMEAQRLLVRLAMPGN